MEGKLIQKEKKKVLGTIYYNYEYEINTSQFYKIQNIWRKEQPLLGKRQKMAVSWIFLPHSIGKNLIDLRKLKKGRTNIKDFLKALEEQVNHSL